MKEYSIVFPGQGSQFIGMLYDLSKKYKIIKNIFDHSSSILGYDLWNKIQNGTTKELNKTYITQPAILTSSIAIYKIWQNKINKKPKFIAGHSLGEYTGLVCAGVINFTDAIKLVEIRGKIMHNAIPKNTGLMKAIIGIKKNIIQEICKKNSDHEIVTPVNYNSNNQIVIAGHLQKVIKVSYILKNMGAKILNIPINIPAHCILMKPAAIKLSKVIKKIKFKIPYCNIINNNTIKCENNPKLIKKYLIKQLYNPVYWVKIIKFIESKNIKNIIEIGPKNILTKLINKITKKIFAISINNDHNLSLALKKIKL